MPGHLMTGRRLTVLVEAMTAAAAAGGTAMVQAAGTDFWAWCRVRGARLIGRGDPGRETEALERLDQTAAALAAASDDEERERVGIVHARLWRGEFASLLDSLGEQEREQAAAELRAIAAEFGSSDVAAGGVVSDNTFNGPTNFQTGNHNHQENKFGSA
ncbi:hypothetical protein AB0D42_34865 [Streptomyces sp. NPDC048304]|uniref:hypothetical protein n=1 Tax=Streptomyces sp. NPDC048304 TaxID=3154820 RepID=UPI0033F1A665